MKTQLSLFLASLVLCGSVPLSGQSATGTSAQATTANADDSAAVTIVKKTIASMGGEAWAAVGAATVQLTVTDAHQHTIVATASHDWSKGSPRKRLDRAMGTGGRTSTTMDLGAVSMLVVDSKVTRMGPASYDLTRLAELYPVAALRLALNRPECQFRAGSFDVGMTPEDVGGITLDCILPNDPMHHERLFWHFDDAGVLKSVRVPVAAVPNVEFYQTFRFRGFQQVQGLTVPTTVETVRNGQVMQTAVLSSVTFQASLPEELFSAAKVQQ